MNKFKIKARTFNNKEISPEVEIFINFGQEDKILPLSVYEALKKRFKIDKFAVVSRDLEKLKSLNIKVESEDLLEKLSTLMEKMLSKEEKIENEYLKRAKILLEEKELSKAKEILNAIDTKSLSEFEFKEFLLAKFWLEPSKELFLKLKTLFEKDYRLKDIFFIYIKYLEDIRDEKEPFKILKEFEEHFGVSSLDDEEKALYYYLKGRNLYLRGEFIDALKNFITAKELTKNDKLKAKIYNSAANSFTDNLFFKEAFEISKIAYEIREKLKLPDIAETISLQAGIYQKSANFKKAYSLYKKAKEMMREENSRIYNYLAKTALFAGYFVKAKEYIYQSEKLENENEKRKGFLTLIKMLYFFYEDDKELMPLYKKTFALPEIKKDYDKFVLGWAYTILARKAFRDNSFDDGIKFLYKAIGYFLDDKYILEAYYVSLYVYVHSLPLDYINAFLNLTGDFDLKNRFKNYIDKHVIIKEFANKFEIKRDKKNNLLEFFNKTKNIDKKRYSPKKIEEHMGKFSLI